MKFKIRKHIKKFELQLQRANARNQQNPTKPVQHGKLIPLRRNMLDEMFWNKQSRTLFFSSFLKLYNFCNCASHSNNSSNMVKT